MMPVNPIPPGRFGGGNRDGRGAGAASAGAHAAGAAGLAKATLALYHRILPPMITCRGRTHARLAQASSPFYVNAATRPWIEGGTHPRRAGVTAFDSACAHAHAVLEEHPSNR